jgi:hypothetical protein
MGEPSLFERMRLDLTAAGAHRGIVETLETLAMFGCTADAEAVARGAINGIAEWLILKHGRDAAITAFQRKTDSIIANTPPGGPPNGKEQAEAAQQR